LGEGAVDPAKPPQIEDKTILIWFFVLYYEIIW